MICQKKDMLNRPSLASSIKGEVHHQTRLQPLFKITPEGLKRKEIHVSFQIHQKQQTMLP